MRLVLPPGGDLFAAVCAAVPDAEDDGVVVVLPADDAPARAAMARVTVELLAVRRAPRVRVNAVLPGTSAVAADVEAAIAFLEGAGSTTGQLIEVR